MLERLAHAALLVIVLPRQTREVWHSCVPPSRLSSMLAHRVSPPTGSRCGVQPHMKTGPVQDNLKISGRPLRCREGLIAWAPIVWTALQMCSQVALAAVDRSAAGEGAAGVTGTASSGAGFRGGLDEGLMGGTADEDGEALGPPATSGAPHQPSGLPEQGTLGSQSMRLGTAPRLRTRLFAAQ